jgi:hypothetical protein
MRARVDERLTAQPKMQLLNAQTMKTKTSPKRVAVIQLAARVEACWMAGEGRPQPGHVGATSETSLPQSGHLIKGIDTLPFNQTQRISQSR